MVLGGGLAYDAGWREPAATWVVRERNGKPERAPLGVSLAKGLWREAHAITVLATAEDHVLGGPLVLTARTKRETMDVWCGALAANKSKLLDTVEAVLHIPASMFATEGHRLYQQGVACAENRGRMLNRAVSACHRAMKDELDKAEFRNRGNLVKAKAASHYWTAIEQKVPLLLALVEDPAPLRPDGSMREQWSTTDWGKALATAAREAYELACPRATSRQLQAYATGLNVLFRPIEEDRTDERNTEEDTNEGSMD
jgi:CRISPR type I-E-associated protein CasA/Cse1